MLTQQGVDFTVHRKLSVIGNRQLINKISSKHETSKAFGAVAFSFYKAMEWRDSYTAGHQMHVANIAVAIAKEFNWSNDRLKGLHLAGIVHDLGKLAIPIEILTKPFRLSTDELDLIQQHPEVGYQILKDIPFPWPIAEIVRQHHERLDGSGYPRNLIATDILEEAKILAIADTIEAMAFDRPYRAGLGIQAALNEIESEAGKKLDEDYVKVASKIIQETGNLIFAFESKDL